MKFSRKPAEIWWQFDGKNWCIRTEVVQSFSLECVTGKPPTNEEAVNLQRVMQKVQGIFDKEMKRVMQTVGKAFEEAYGPGEPE